MQTRKPIKSQIAGLILAGVLIVLSTIMSIGGDKGSRPGGGWISYLAICIGLIIFINLYAKAKDNFVTFGELFSYGFKTISVTTLVFLIFILILAFTMPELKQQAIEATRVEMAKNKSFSQDNVEQGIQLIEKYFWVFMAGATMLSFLIVGAIGSLIGAAIPQKKSIVYRDQLDQLDR